MTLEELKQIKDSLDKGVLIHRKRWLEVLEWAINVTKTHIPISEEGDAVFIDGRGIVPLMPFNEDLYQIVPKEPTEKMLLAYEQMSKWSDDSELAEMEVSMAYDGYKALLIAAKEEA